MATTPEDSKSGTCFFVTPIGAADSPERDIADGLLDLVLNPVVRDGRGLSVIAAHTIDQPGSITRQIVRLLLTAELVVADLTGPNPNVMYELAVRHATGLPVVTLAQDGTVLPFDVAAERTIFYKPSLGGVGPLRAAVRRAVDAALQDGKTDNLLIQEATSPLLNDGESRSDMDHILLRRMEQLERAVQNQAPPNRPQIAHDWSIAVLDRAGHDTSRMVAEIVSVLSDMGASGIRIGQPIESAGGVVFDAQFFSDHRLSAEDLARVVRTITGMHLVISA